MCRQPCGAAPRAARFVPIKDGYPPASVHNILVSQAQALQSVNMVTTRHASYSPEKLDSPATDNASARKAKRGADDVSKASPSTKRRKIEAQKPKPANAAAQPKQSIRIRFGSEEADAVPPAIVPEAEPADLDAEDDEEEAEDEDDSDDEAPEDISAIAAQKNAEATAAAAALAVEKYVVRS